MYLNSITEPTTNILNSKGGIALVGKIFQDIGLDLESDTVLKSAEKSIPRILAGLMNMDFYLRISEGKCINVPHTTPSGVYSDYRE